MTRHYRAIALAFALAASTLASAQTGGTASNPVARPDGGDVFFYSPLSRQQPGQTFGRGALDNTGIGRPNQRSQQVTPVPEPSQWALMLAGLALVGFIARRSSRSSRDNA